MSKTIIESKYVCNLYNECKCHPSDVFVAQGKVTGEGRWVWYIEFMDEQGNYYQVWQDQDGDEKVVDGSRCF